jgi:predicted DNA-binding transcriptional regulator AlpA
MARKTSDHPQQNPLLITAEQLAQMANASTSTIWRWDAGGKLPAAIKIGQIKRWRRDEIEAWIAVGCPDRRSWEALKRSGKGPRPAA